jgi:hypothetical protein
MDKVKAVYLCSNAEFPIAVFYANNFSLATKLDRLSSQGKIQTQRKVQIPSFSKEMIRQEINALSTDIARYQLFLSDVNSNLNLETLRRPFFIMTHSFYLYVDLQENNLIVLNKIDALALGSLAI